jgi:hypothetical protein
MNFAAGEKDSHQKIPGSKLQAPEKLRIPNSKRTPFAGSIALLP